MCLWVRWVIGVIPALFAKVVVSDLQSSLYSRDRGTDDRTGPMVVPLH
eukprot:XP_001704470.1 Hypothetical protein GL50803_36482 [Giardia lamblia ATCC 50803]